MVPVPVHWGQRQTDQAHRWDRVPWAKMNCTLSRWVDLTCRRPWNNATGMDLKMALHKVRDWLPKMPPPLTVPLRAQTLPPQGMPC